MQVQVQFNADTQVNLEDMIEGEPYEDPQGTMYVLMFTEKNEMFLWCSKDFKLYPIENFRQTTHFIHKGTINSITLKR